MVVPVAATENSARLKFKAALSTLAIFEIFALTIFLLFLYAAVVRHVGWEGAFLAGTVCIAIFIWWQSFAVEIDGVELRYKSLFSRKKVIALCQITRAVRKIELASQGNRPPNRIEIYGTVDGRDMNFDINVKPFRLADAKKIEQLLHVV
jgi:hypothetical protein